jgi:small GTP-binding protein
MAFNNPRTKEIQAKIVYYGPGRGGKTTNLEWIYEKFRSRVQSEIVSLKTAGDRTIFFDFLPMEVGVIFGHKVRIQLYTVPGQIKYNATRKLVLRGADGVVFVADSMQAVRQKNLHSLKNLHENLKSYRRSIFKVPLVLQYNKVDLAAQGIPITPFEVMQKDLNTQLKAPAFKASALTGHNVTQTLKKITEMTMLSIRKHLEK